MWLFVLAGQSNMAGRGLVEPEDTISNPQIWAMDSLNQWIPAREPLHFYEPSRKGLDCGLSFARELLKINRDSIQIGLIPCAVGGSSVEQWLYDSTHRGVPLYSNFIEKTARAKSFGTFKGIIWHQGEANANDPDLSVYSLKLDSLFSRMRASLGQPDLTIVMGELGQFLPESSYHQKQIELNNLLRSKADNSPNLALASSAGLEHKGDSVHFNSASLRELGKRYARAFIHY